MRNKRAMLKTTKDNQEVVGMGRRKSLSYANTSIRQNNVQRCKRLNLVVRNSKALKSYLHSRGGIANNKPLMRSQDLIGHSVRGVTYL